MYLCSRALTNSKKTQFNEFEKNFSEFDLLKGYEIFEQLVLRVSVSDCLNFSDSRKKKKKKTTHI